MREVITMRTPLIETKRLQLRTFVLEDAQEALECWESDPEVARYMMWQSHNDIEKTRGFMQREISKIDNEEWYRWCITDKSTNEIMGTCLIYWNDEENCWDIAYNLGRKYWGKGYTTEAMKAVMEFAINTLHVKEVIATHAIENPASGKVIEKLGFVYEREVEYICNGGTIHTTGKQYRLTM